MGWELQNDNSTRVPISFINFVLTAPCKVLTTCGFNGRFSLPHKFLVFFPIANFDVENYNDGQRMDFSRTHSVVLSGFRGDGEIYGVRVKAQEPNEGA